MRMAASVALLVFLAVPGATGFSTVRQDPPQAADNRQAISYDQWLTAKEKAEKYDAEGKFIEALQYYLEYTRQAEGLGRRDLAAWGKNNAAYMIIKMHKQDPTVDLAPAKKMIEEAMAMSEASEGCRKLLALNLEYVKLYIDRAS